MADVFISYAHADNDNIAALAIALEAEGLSVWWDKDIEAGKTFDKVIDSELEAAKVVVVAWSAISVESRWVREEANDALEVGKLVPIRIEDIPLPRGFKLIQTIDMLDAADVCANPHWEQLVERLCQMSVSNAKANDEPLPDQSTSTPKKQPPTKPPATTLDYYTHFTPKRFTILSATYLAMGRFALAPFSYLFYSLIYLFLPFYLIAVLTEWLLFQEAAATSSKLNFDFTFITISLLNTFIIYLSSFILQAKYSVKIQAEAYGLHGIKAHLGEFNTRIFKIISTSLVIAIIFTLLDSVYKISNNLKGDLPSNFVETYPLIYAILAIVYLFFQIIISILVVRYSLAPSIAAIEGTNFTLSMKRSRELIRGHAWRFFGITLLTMMLGMFVFVLLVPSIWPTAYDIAYLQYLHIIADTVPEKERLITEMRQEGSMLQLLLVDAFTENKIQMAFALAISIAIGSIMRTEAFFQIYASKNAIAPDVQKNTLRSLIKNVRTYLRKKIGKK